MHKLIMTVGIALALSGCDNPQATATGSAAAASSAAPAAAKPQAPQSNLPPLDPKNIVSIAIGSKDHTTLVTALKAADYVRSLQNAGPFTVFAPTNAAFAKLPKGTVEDLLKPENKERLVAILTYHVVAGKVMAADVKTMKAMTVNGKELSIVVADGKVTVDKANVVKTDVAAKNGVIHVIDTVMLPN